MLSNHKFDHVLKHVQDAIGILQILSFSAQRDGGITNITGLAKRPYLQISKVFTQWQIPKICIETAPTIGDVNVEAISHRSMRLNITVNMSISIVRGR